MKIFSFFVTKVNQINSVNCKSWPVQWVKMSGFGFEDCHRSDGMMR